MFRTFGPGVEQRSRASSSVDPTRRTPASTTIDLGGRQRHATRGRARAHARRPDRARRGRGRPLRRRPRRGAAVSRSSRTSRPTTPTSTGALGSACSASWRRSAPRLVVPGHGAGRRTPRLIATQRALHGDDARRAVSPLVEAGRARPTRRSPSSSPRSSRSTPTGCSPSGSRSGSAASTPTEEGGARVAVVAADNGRCREPAGRARPGRTPRLAGQHPADHGAPGERADDAVRRRADGALEPSGRTRPCGSRRCRHRRRRPPADRRDLPFVPVTPSAARASRSAHGGGPRRAGSASAPRARGRARAPRARRRSGRRARARWRGLRTPSPGTRASPSRSPRWRLPCAPAPPPARARRARRGGAPRRQRASTRTEARGGTA